MQLITNKTSNLDSLYLGGAAMKDLFCTKAATKSAIIAKQSAQRRDFFFFIDCSNFSSLRGKSGKSGRDLAPVVWNSYSPPRQRDRASLYWTSHWKYFRGELKYYFAIFPKKLGYPPKSATCFLGKRNFARRVGVLGVWGASVWFFSAKGGEG